MDQIDVESLRKRLQVDELRQRLSAEESAPKQETMESSESTPTSIGSKLFSGAYHFGQQVPAGFGDEVSAAVDTNIEKGRDYDWLNKQYAEHVLGIKGASDVPYPNEKARKLSELLESYRQNVKMPRERGKYESELNPISSTLGGAGGGVVSSMYAGPTSILGNTVLGGVQGLGNSEADLTNGDTEEIINALFDTGKSAAIAGGVSAAGKLFTSGKEINDAAGRSYLRSQGARGTQMTPYELEGPGGLQEAANTAMDEGVFSPLASHNTILKRSNALSARGSEQMGEVLEGATKKGISTPHDLLYSKARGLEDFNPRLPSNASEKTVVDKMLGDVAETGSGSIGQYGQGSVNPLEVQDLKNVWAKQARYNRLGELPDQMAAAQKYREGTNILKNQIDEMVAPQGDAALSTLQQGRKLHGAGEEIGDLANRAAGNANASGLEFNLVSPKHGVLGSISGKANQLAGGGLRTISKMVAQSPESFGPFAPVLRNAIARGPAAFAAANHVLQQTKEGYRTILKQLNGQESPEGR